MDVDLVVDVWVGREDLLRGGDAGDERVDISELVVVVVVVVAGLSAMMER